MPPWNWQLENHIIGEAEIYLWRTAAYIWSHLWIYLMFVKMSNKLSFRFPCNSRILIFWNTFGDWRFFLAVYVIFTPFLFHQIIKFCFKICIVTLMNGNDRFVNSYSWTVRISEIGLNPKKKHDVLVLTFRYSSRYNSRWFGLYMNGLRISIDTRCCLAGIFSFRVECGCV